MRTRWSAAIISERSTLLARAAVFDAIWRNGPRSQAPAADENPELPTQTGSMKVGTWNVNGLSSKLHHVRGLLQREAPAALALNEVKCRAVVLERLVEGSGYRCLSSLFPRPQHHGVALLLRDDLEALPLENRNEVFRGRMVSVLLPAQDIVLVAVYVPNAGVRGQHLRKLEHRLTVWEPAFREWLAQLRAAHTNVLVLGDLNVVPTLQDVHLPRLRRRAGMTLEEREAFADWLRSGWRDVWRSEHEEAKDDGYTFWSKSRFGDMRPQNKGWRLDFAITTDDRVHGATVLEENVSDHAPLLVTIDAEAKKAPTPRHGACAPDPPRPPGPSATRAGHCEA